MKWFTLAALAGAVMLGACTTNPKNDTTASLEESYTPTGTIIPRKDPKRLDMPVIMNQQTLENERAMNSANSDGNHK